MPESVSAHATDSRRLRCSCKFLFNSGVGVREHPELDGARKRPIICGTEPRSLSPCPKRVSMLSAKTNVFAELSGLHSSTCCLTMPRRIWMRDPRQSTSDHRSANASETRRPKHTHSRAIVANGSCNSLSRVWNCSTLDSEAFARGGLLRCFVQEKWDCARHRAILTTLQTPGVNGGDCEREFSIAGDKGRLRSHNSTGRGCTSRTGVSPHSGRM